MTKPTSSNPIHNIPDLERHEVAWEKFVSFIGTLGRDCYESTGMTTARLGELLRNESRARPQTVSERIVVLAYQLRLRELEVRDFMTSAVAMHHPRGEIVELTLMAKFDLYEHALAGHYDDIRQQGKMWLDTFGPSPLGDLVKGI